MATTQTSKRIFDILLSLYGIACLIPIGAIIALSIRIGSKGPIFYFQKRVGINGEDFSVFKFRTMYTGSDKKGLLTVGNDDSRITDVGAFLRKTKLDELPQLVNVLIGDMSFVGPRPEVRKYVDLYTPEQLKVLSIRPGITDYASLEYINENEILGKSKDPEKTYIEEIMPAKLKLNMQYLAEQSLQTDVNIIWKTISKIVK